MRYANIANTTTTRMLYKTSRKYHPQMHSQYGTENGLKHNAKELYHMRMVMRNAINVMKCHILDGTTNIAETAAQEWMVNRMDDLISRQTAIDALGERPMVWTSDDDYSLGERNQYDIDRLAVETVPSVDAVDVVRCKDCYHYDEESEKCILNNSEMKPMDYCSYGSK